VVRATPPVASRTNDLLVAARRIYLAAGFVLTGEEPHHSYGVDLGGQTYELEL
jgi:hypothetical protein